MILELLEVSALLFYHFLQSRGALSKATVFVDIGVMGLATSVLPLRHQ